MAVIGILNCKMLQDEIIYLIQNDSEIKDITVIENGEHEEFIQKLNENGISYSLAPMIHSVPDLNDRNDRNDQNDQNNKNNQNEDGLSLIVWNLELGLHEKPKLLKEEVYKDLEIFAKKVDGIYLLYGLCGNVLGHVEDDFKDVCPVVILRDPEGEIVDDCIGATLGGRRQYLNLLRSFHGVGTFIFTPMYEATTDEFFNHSRDRNGFTEEQMIEMNKFMFESSNYKRIARLETGLHYTKDTEEPLKRFADTYNFEIFDLEGGNQKVFDECYQKLKNQISEKSCSV
ncbi:hypothetical protein MmiHf6_03330 [Methanimicrococcus hongohii]|uniref:DUF1638 domain-containing protein n=1 Tax=Methanimicrococcus hongohii TaxID=3028295 RepID=A0AA96UYM6_9EURY|nr:DUF1638 domain-containing protein [Methanimicrococcus sp. Hf6]WNY23037.1 hypothetical protein MmiHf6_03330 [Methanimicrococcus sp. Hf6]